MTNVVSVTQARDNFSELLGLVKFGEQVITIEKKGKPQAIMISPGAYIRYQEAAKKAFMNTVKKIQARNVKLDPANAMKDITKIVEKVRQERYDKQKKALSGNY